MNKYLHIYNIEIKFVFDNTTWFRKKMKSM